jgi:YVTN family beta-propeller protein
MSAMRTRLLAAVCVLLTAACLASQGLAKPMDVTVPDYPDTVVASVTTGSDAFAPGATSDGRFVYVPTFYDNTVSVIRTSDNAEMTRIPVSGRPSFALSSRDGEYVYVSCSRGSSVARIRVSDNTVVGSIPTPTDPWKMAFSQDDSLLYVGLFRSSSDRIAVVRLSDDSIIATPYVGCDPWGLAVTTDDAYLYVGLWIGDCVSVLRTSDYAIVDSIHTGIQLNGLCMTPDGMHVYVAAETSNAVYAIRTSDNSVVATIPIADQPTGLAMLPNGKYVYVASYASDYVSVIRTSDNTVVKQIRVGVRPDYFAVLPDGSAVYVSVHSEGCVKVIGNVDVGPVSVLSPSGTVDSGSVYQPRVIVRNLGPTSQTPPVTMNIGAGYSHTVQETLASRMADTVVFPSWTAGPAGTLAVTCFTSLVGDEDPTNDTTRDSVRVVAPLTNDVGAITVLSPTGTVDSGSVRVPSAIVRNFGLASAVFPVTMTIGSGYIQTAQETLSAGVTDTMVFPTWTAEPVGLASITCFTSLLGDEEPTNDTVMDSSQVVRPARHDVGALAIVSPTGGVRAGDTVIPQARIRNFGDAQERFFDVRFRLGASYNEKVNVADALPAGSTAELAFPPWVTEAGDWAVSCSTMLASDVDRANDKVSSSVRVFRQSLQIAPDQSGQLAAGQSQTYRFYALVQGDTGALVEVARPSPPPSWGARLCNAAGADDLTDTDGDGIPDLGYVAPGESGRFSLDVTAPSGTHGDTASLSQITIPVAGSVSDRPDIADTAALTLTLVPEFSVHNFPNPFTDHTSFVIGLPEDGKASLTVYTRDGARVCRVLANADLPAGVHLVRWDGVNDNGRTLAPGTYEYVLDYVHAGKTDRIRKKLVLTRQ